MRDFQPLRAIEAINSMFQHRPKVIVNIENMPKVEKVDNAMPILPESSASIEAQIDAFVDSGKTCNGKPYSKASKYVYSQNIKTLMQRMREPNLDFLVKKVPQVLAHLHKVDEPSELQDAYHARLSSRAFETVAVVFLPLAGTKDHNERIVAKHQYNEWLKVHPMLKQKGQVKDYGGKIWTDIVREMTEKVHKSRNKLHKLILSLYTDTPPRRSMDYTNMLINVPDDHEHNILIFQPNMKKFIFNKYKTVNKKGPQHILIESPSLIKIIEEFLKEHPKQKYLLMRNGEPLDDKQIREILRTELGTKSSSFGIQAIRRLFATYIIKEKETNPRN